MRFPHRGNDRASTHVLEAIIIVSIMVSAVAFVVTVEQPPPPTFNAREALEVKARDVLDIMYDTPVSDTRYGANELSSYIAQCLNEKCSDLEAKLQKLVPPGASYALYVSNGYATYPVLVQGKPRGEAVTASRTFQPDWSSTFLATATESIGANDALLTYALPIFHSTPVSPGGSQIFVKVSGTRVSDGSDYVLIASAATTAQELNDPSAIAASLTFVDSAGKPLPVHDMDPVELTPYRLTLRLAESQNAAEIPAGAEVVVNTPRGWTASAPQAANPGWTVIANADDKNGAYVGSVVRATLNAPLRNGQRDLLLDLTYHGDVLDYYPLTASLTKGANAMAATILRGETHSSVPPLATPLVHMSVPGPMGWGADTTWTLSAYIPVNEDAELPQELRSAIRVHTVELIEQEGNPIFKAGAGAVTASVPERMGGDWTSSGTTLTWKGDVLLDAQTLLNLTFRVPASGTAGPSETRSHFVPPVTFDTWTGRLNGRTGWGFYRQAILPADDTYEGYDPQAGVLGVPHPLTTEGVYRQTTLPGAIEYNVSLAGAVQDALYGSYVIAEQRTVPPDGEVVISANVQSVLFTLAEAGQRAGVTLRFYAPWSGDERDPEWEQPMLDQNLLTGEVSQLVTLDLNNDGLPDPIVGTTNGRVLAYDGRTGQRLQGNAWTVVPNQLATAQGAVPKVTAMETVRLFGQDYIVVATDKYSDGLFVLDRDFKIRWRYTLPNADALAIDVTTSFDGDNEPEIVVARAEDVGATKYAVVYVLKAEQAETTLRALPMKDPPVEDPDRLALVLGTPTDILARSRIGPRGEWQGVMVPVQTNVDPGVQVTYVPGQLPAVTQGPSSTPRAGVQGLNEMGEVTGTLFGAPASVLRGYDYHDDNVGDLVMGGSSGYVVMANGSVLTQPIYSLIVAGWSKIVSADTRSSSESYLLTQDGQVIMTDDAWVSMYGPVVSAVGAKAISSNAFNSYWVVGSANKVWKSAAPAVPEPEDLTKQRHPATRELVPVTLSAMRNGVAYDFASHVHEFRDVHFRGSVGYIVGAACALPVLCGEPIMLKTTDGGANWLVLSSADGTLVNRNGGALDKNLTRVKVVDHDGTWTGWSVGDGGLVARTSSDGATWKELDLGFAYDVSYDFRDIGCLPKTPNTCWVVGESGAAFVTYDALAATPTWTNKTGTEGLPLRDLFSVGFPEDTRGYIGSGNMVLASFRGSEWTALPLNYFENDGRVVSTAGDGGGFVFGGTDANGRIWFLQDYHTQSQATTKSFASRLPADAHIYAVQLIDGNVSFAQQQILVNVTEGTSWKTLGGGPIAAGTGGDPRKPTTTAAVWDTQSTDIATYGRDFRAQIVFNTSPDKTLLTPSIRELKFRVHYVRLPSNVAGSEDISLDLTDLDDVDKLATTADWNITTHELRQPFVNESWTRNVSGEVHDIQTGFDITGDSYDEVWVATGDVLSENSPDYIIYAGTDPDRVMEKHNRVYLLSGRNGHPLAVSDKLDGEVRHIRLVDQDSAVAGPEMLFAATWDTSESPIASGRLYALHPTTLAILWSQSLGREVPADLEVGLLPDANPTALVGDGRPAGESETTPHLWSIPHVAPRPAWKSVPDELGRYLIRKAVDPGWFYGPHVVEIAVEWEETVSETQVNFNLDSMDEEDLPPIQAQGCPETIPEEECPESPEGSTVLRAARFYDHFMIAPPQAVLAPNPVYTARLLVWLDDWG